MSNYIIPPSATDSYRTGDQTLVRHMNLSVILHHLRRHAPLSRAALAEATGLNKTTVSSLVRELIEWQFVHEVGFETAGTGRPAVLLELNPTAGYMVSGEIGVDFLSIMCSNFAPEVIWQHREDITSDAKQETVFQRLLDLMAQAVKKCDERHGKLLGVALGVPGLVDRQDGTLLFAPNLGWQNVPLRAPLEALFDVPVFVDNEAKMAALGEYYFGAAQGYSEVLYISAGVGLGGGIVQYGRLYTGFTGIAGEFGHMTIEPEGLPCNCGNRGCWETLVSQSAVFSKIRHGLAQGGESVLHDMVQGNLDCLTFSLVIEAAHRGDSLARQTLEEVGQYLGLGIASLVNILNPELVVFGGILSLGGEFLLPVVEKELCARAMRWSREASEVVLAHHGADACLIGGIATIYQAVLTQPSQMR